MLPRTASVEITVKPDSPVGWLPPAMAWRMTFLLTVAYLVSFLDRFVIALLIEPIKSTMQLDDLQIGLLLGPAFALFYLTLGLPIGWLADRASRRLIVVVAIATWSLMTALCGLAGSFWPLFLARVGVGIGEAALAPCAVSMIGDAFAPARRARAIGVYMNGAFLGSATTFLLGGTLIAALEALAPVSLPGIGAVQTWQLAFIAVGLPGVPIALALLTVAEPPRARDRETGVTTRASRRTGDAAPVAERRADDGTPHDSALRYAARHWRGYGTLLAGMSGVLAIGAMTQWNVALFQRNWNWSVAQTGIAMGLVILGTALPGTTFSGWLTSRWLARGHDDAPRRVVLLGLLIFAPAAILGPLMPNGAACLVCVAIAFLGQAIAVAAGPAALIDLTPGRHRSQLAALYWSVISVVGLLLGPSSVGALADALGGPAHLGTSLAVMAGVFGVPSLVVLVAGAGAYRRSLAARVAGRE